MENEEREVRGMAVVWKRLMALAVFLLVLSMLESDGIEQEIMRISIGYCAEGGSRLVSYGLEEDRFEDQNFIPVIYMYDNEAEILLPSRGVAASGFPPLCNIPHCCLP